MSWINGFKKRSKLTATGTSNTTDDTEGALQVGCGVQSTYSLNASRGKLHTLTHKCSQPHSPHYADKGGVMSLNRHWSRHAFRNIPKAQYTFKSLLIHGILQFTMLITLRCALHRCSSRDIRRWKLYRTKVFTHFRISAQWFQDTGSRSRKGGRSNSALLLPPSFLMKELMLSPSLTNNLTVDGSQWFKRIRANDPSAGSPTETLLRLLLPLSDKVH